MYHIVGNLLSLLVGVDPLTILWVGAFFVIEYALTNWHSPVGGIVAIVTTVIGLISGIIIRRVYGITTVTSHYAYDIPTFDATQRIPQKKSKPVLWGIYGMYLLISLSPMVAFFMSDIRIDTDVIRVPGKYILPQCLDIRRYVLTEYYPLGMAMTGIVYGALAIMCIMLETRYLLYSPARAIPEMAKALQFRTFHTVIIYGGTLYQVSVYVLTSMLLKLDVLWLYIITLAVGLITMLATRSMFRFAVSRVAGIWELPSVLFMAFWPCVRSKKTTPVIPETSGAKRTV